jgi:hypothetical protein
MGKFPSAEINNTTEVGELLKELKIPGNAVKLIEAVAQTEIHLTGH